LSLGQIEDVLMLEVILFEQVWTDFYLRKSESWFIIHDEME